MKNFVHMLFCTAQNQYKTSTKVLVTLLLCLVVCVGNSWGVNNGDLFERISSAPSANDEVIIVNSGGTVVLGGQNGNFRDDESITTSSNQYIYKSTDKAQVLTIKVVSGYYGFFTGSGFLQQPSNNNYLTTNSATFSATLGDAQKWSLTAGTTFTITSKRNTDYMLQYNASSTRFATYKASSKQANPSIYKKVMSAPTAVAASSITSSGATITITDGTNVNNYELYYGTSSTAPTASSTATTTITSGKSKSITGLTASTRYYVWARAFSTSPARKTGWVALTGTSFTTSAAVTTYTIYLPNTTGGCSSIGSYTSNQGTLGSGTGGWTGYKTYSGITAGTSVTITASAESGYQFDGWTDGGYSIIVDDEANEVTPSSTTSTTATFDMPSSDVYILSCYFSSEPSCANTMTISKGTGTNCTFTLGTSGSGLATCDGVSTTVSITPNSGYGKNPSVTQSGASAAPTITGSANSWTVAYGANTTGTSTINVSCAANDYTITLDKDLTPTTTGAASIIATYNSNNNLTSAISTPTKTGWTFAGYFTAKNGGGTQIIDASGNVIASAGGGSTYTDASRNWKYAGNITLYAKWTCTVTWSVNGATDIYDAQTLTYNGTSTKVGSVPGPPSPASYCGQKFAGWTDAAIDGTQVAAPSTLFTTVAGSPELKTVGNKTFYAVFADYDE